MAVDKAFEAFAVDLFAGLGSIRVKRMFGGAMVYAGELGFALLDDEAIWIKVDDLNQAAFVEVGAPRFTFPMKDGKVIEMSYCRLPESAMDDPDEALSWAQLGVQASMRAHVKKAKR